MSTRFDATPTRNDAQAMQQPRHELAALIERVRELNDWSDSDVVRRAEARGHKLSKSNISRVRNTDVVSLTASTIKGLAAGLGVPETEIARAALVSMGIDMPDLGGLDLETVIKMDSSISVHNRTMLLGLVRQMRRPNLEDEHGAGIEEVPEPRTKEGSTKHGRKTGADRGRPGAPMNEPEESRDDNVTALKRQDQDSQLDDDCSSRNPLTTHVASEHGDDAPPFDPTKVLAAKRGKKSDTQ
ncbi:hypothetical protein [Rhodococcus sp. 11-3]|uniref:hypothetical protein n=1 Tax=Rhodococcus sp. 11-3 TaxID=2854796 RepID=UPI0020426AC1|nr:hypothetical protein [Rhodococcus sp. 11-3]USC16197.1 hypothetical protein KZJ41_04530 [Rhodococcus sp. 11-3]